MDDNKHRAPQKGFWKAVSPSDAWIFRTPFFSRKAWRVRYRNRFTGEVGCTTVRLGKEEPEGEGDIQRAREIVEKMAYRADNAPKTEAGPPPPSIADAIAKFLDEKDDGVRRAGTIRDYRMSLERTILPKLLKAGVKTPRDITRDHVVDIVLKSGTKMRKSKKRSEGDKSVRPWSLRTRQKYLMLLRFFLRWCVLCKYVTENVAMTYDGPKPKNIKKDQEKRVGIALTEEQARALLRACRDPFTVKVKCESGERAGSKWKLELVPPEHLHLAVMIGLRTGLRSSNITGLRVEHLRNDCTELRIADEEMKANEALRVPIHPELQPYLRQALKRIRQEKGRAPVGKDHILGDVKHIRKLFDRAAKRAGLDKVYDEQEDATKCLRFHDLRHTFVSWIEDHCGSKEHSSVTKILVGHTRPDVTERYKHIRIERLREEINKLPWLEPPDAGQETNKAN